MCVGGGGGVHFEGTELRNELSGVIKSGEGRLAPSHQGGLFSPPCSHSAFHMLGIKNGCSNAL